MGFVGNYAPCGLSPQTDGMPVIHTKESTLDSFGNENKVRKLPLPNGVAEILLARKNEMLNAAEDIDNERFYSSPIIEGCDTAVGISRSFLSPRKLNKICRELIESLGIEEERFSVPANNFGIDSENLSAVHGDLFKQNFRHYLVRESNLSKGDISYILGTQAPDVGHNNYIDCAEETKQIHIQKAIESVHLILKGKK